MKFDTEIINEEIAATYSLSAAYLLYVLFHCVTVFLTRITDYAVLCISHSAIARHGLTESASR